VAKKSIFAAILCPVVLANKLSSLWNFMKLISVNYSRLISRVDRALGRTSPPCGWIVADEARNINGAR